MTNPTPAPAARGLIDRVLAAYKDIPASVRSLIAERPSEATLLSFILIAAIVNLCGEIAGRTMTGAGARSEEELGRLSASMVGRLIVFPLAVYLVSAMAYPLVRAFGGRGGGYETRVAFAWAAVIAAPAAFAGQILGASGDLGPYLTAPLAALGIYMLSACIAGAHGFASTVKVAAAIVVILLGAFGVGLLVAQIPAAS
ncbi:MAG: hypothetical protein KTR21_07040 [Rhodobacteraceae bacterium]|nr:hypothetical protein [Paracoccaceae bacterium]